MLMYQCRMEQNNCYTVGWIEERGAKLNARVEIPELGGLWKVVSIGGSMLKSALQKKQVSDRDCFGSLAQR